MPVLSQAPAHIVDFVNNVVEAYHPDLLSSEVRIDVLLASPTDREIDHDLPPLKLHGYAAAAVARVVPLKQRVKGCGDVEVTICEQSWKDLDDDERTALIDHECSHFNLAVDHKSGQVKTDDCGRPKLKMRLHDVQAGWFLDVAKRHGMASMEVKQAREIQEKYGQLLFSWAEGPPSLAAMAGQSA
jgi:hypothetical protein